MDEVILLAAMDGVNIMVQQAIGAGSGFAKKGGVEMHEGKTAELCKLLESGGVKITDSAIALGKRCARK